MKLQPPLKGHSGFPSAPETPSMISEISVASKGGGSEQSLVCRPYPSGTWIFLQGKLSFWGRGVWLKKTKKPGLRLRREYFIPYNTSFS